MMAMIVVEEGGCWWKKWRGGGNMGWDSEAACHVILLKMSVPCGIRCLTWTALTEEGYI